MTDYLYEVAPSVGLTSECIQGTRSRLFAYNHYAGRCNLGIFIGIDMILIFGNVGRIRARSGSVRS